LDDIIKTSLSQSESQLCDGATKLFPDETLVPIVL